MLEPATRPSPIATIARPRALLRRLAVALLVSSCATPPAGAPAASGGVSGVTAEDLSVRAAQVEYAFASTMHDRDFAAFQRFIDDQAIFRSSPSQLLHGKAAILAVWQKYFGPGPAPFSWQPDSVTVDQSGTLAISTGPVFDPSGRVIARYTSIWRRVGSGSGVGDWRIIVDQGVQACDCAHP